MISGELGLKRLGKFRDVNSYRALPLALSSGQALPTQPLEPPRSLLVSDQGVSMVPNVALAVVDGDRSNRVGGCWSTSSLVAASPELADAVQRALLIAVLRAFLVSGPGFPLFVAARPYLSPRAERSSRHHSF